ncbi:hypothetical protein ACC691_41715, partial [Rhizobium johnstonii]|uniref:hypothetical protein n=1 Tax=Rhizobium johnstonii TaxID=3019933 RepID=UPI003F98BD80
AVDQLTGEGYLEVTQGAAARVASVGATSSHARPAVPTETAEAASVRVNMVPGLPGVDRLDERAWRAAWRDAASRS